jgi:hypothetical protein
MTIFLTSSALAAGADALCLLAALLATLLTTLTSIGRPGGTVPSLRIAAPALAAAALVTAIPGWPHGWAVALAALAFLAAVQSSALAWLRRRRLADYASDPPGADGSPVWWDEFEAEFRRHKNTRAAEDA